MITEFLFNWFDLILDLIKTEGVQVAESPRRNYIKDTDSDYVKLAKTGGHQGKIKHITL